MDIEYKILSRKRFCDMVEEYIYMKDVPYMEAVIDLMSEHEIEPERVPNLINISIKDKIEAEARDLNFLEQINKLPI
jgi:hypothetical protein